jgi:putative FmdB family regulatory protein
MPLYEYQCEACAHRFEVIQKYSDAPIETCPRCNGAVRKLLSSPAIQFKGSGWYITDYARAGKSDSSSSGAPGSSGEKSEKSEKGDSASGASTETKTETKTESKTETKSESTPSKPASS